VAVEGGQRRRHQYAFIRGIGCRCENISKQRKKQKQNQKRCRNKTESGIKTERDLEKTPKHNAFIWFAGFPGFSGFLKGGEMHGSGVYGVL